MADLILDVDAAVVVPVNKVPLISSSDFITTDETIAYNESGMDLNWNFVTTAGVVTQTNVTPTTGGVYDWAHTGNAMYSIEIPASGGGSINNDAEGFGWFSGVCDGVLPWVSPIIQFSPAALVAATVDTAPANVLFITDCTVTRLFTPGSSTDTFRIEFNVKDHNNTLTAPDSEPTVTLENHDGTDRSSRIDDTTPSAVSTGRYRVIYTATAGDAPEALVLGVTASKSGYVGGAAKFPINLVDAPLLLDDILNGEPDTPVFGGLWQNASNANSVVQAVETDTQDIQSRIPAALGANGNIKADVRDYNGTAGTFASGLPDVNVRSHQGTRTLYVSTTGNDANAGTRAAPLATVAAAVSAAVTGDTIWLLAGSHTVTSISTTKRINWRGDRSVGPGTVSEMTSSASNTLTTGTGSTIENLKIGNTTANSAVLAVDLSGRFNVTLRNVVITCSEGQGLYNDEAYGLLIENCNISGVEFGVQLLEASATIRNSTITATQRGIGLKNSQLDSRGSTYTGGECGMYLDDYDGKHISLVGVNDVYKGRNETDTPITAGTRDFVAGMYLETDSAEITPGIQSPVHCTNCLFIAEATHEDFPAPVAGIYHDEVSEGGDQTIVLIGGQVHIENAGDGDSYHFWLDSTSHLVIIGANYDPDLCQGDIVDVPLTAASTLADTAELQGDWANGGRLDLILDARASQTSVDDVPTNAELATAISSGLATYDPPTKAEMDSAISAIDVPTATDTDQQPVPSERTWVAVSTNDGGLEGEALRATISGGARTYAIDFRNTLAFNQRVVTFDSITILTGTGGGVTFGTKGRDRTVAKVPITPVTAGDYVLRATVTDTDGNVHICDVELRVVE